MYHLITPRLPPRTILEVHLLRILIYLLITPRFNPLTIQEVPLLTILLHLLAHLVISDLQAHFLDTLAVFQVIQVDLHMLEEVMPSMATPAIQDTQANKDIQVIQDTQVIQVTQDIRLNKVIQANQDILVTQDFLAIKVILAIQEATHPMVAIPDLNTYLDTQKMVIQVHTDIQDLEGLLHPLEDHRLQIIQDLRRRR